METFVDENGEPLGFSPDVLVVPPALKFQALEVLKSAVVVNRVGEGTAGTGATAATRYTNVLEGALDWWFPSGLPIRTTGSFSPPRARSSRSSCSSRTRWSSLRLRATPRLAFMEDIYLYGVRERHNVGYGLWQCAVGSQVGQVR